MYSAKFPIFRRKRPVPQQPAEPVRDRQADPADAQSQLMKWAILVNRP